MPSQSSKVLLVGLSGPSSSGKTTLARLLRRIWPGSFVLHEDDFYWPDKQIPVKDGIQDWDCLESLDLTMLSDSLRYIKDNGRSPPDLESKEDQNTTGPVDVDEAHIDDWSHRARSLSSQYGSTTIAFIDGFLLYSQDMKHIRDLFDVKLFLWSDYQTTKQRREARSGYVTLEGFWEDPPGYVDRIVWPNYVHDHAFLFKDGDVEADFDEAACHAAGVQPVPRAMNMTKTLDWASSVIQSHLSRDA